MRAYSLTPGEVLAAGVAAGGESASGVGGGSLAEGVSHLPKCLRVCAVSVFVSVSVSVSVSCLCLCLVCACTEASIDTDVI